jgi:microcystin-dependent protein
MGTGPFVGEIRILPTNVVPQGWARCDGQILAISQNTALFSLLGWTYGGNLVSTFALPDLRGRVPIHSGFGPGLTERFRGEQGGAEQHALTLNEMPSHTHGVRGSTGNGIGDAPGGRFPARMPSAIPHYHATPNADLAAAAVQPAGGGVPHTNMQPYLVLNYMIALQGIYPQQP